MEAVLTRRLLIVGSGRSGTGYMAALLNAAGLECGHERIYTDETALASGLPDWVTPASCSWLAVPHLAEERARDTAVVLVVREPFAVAASLLGLGVLADPPSPYGEVIARHHPQTWAWRREADRALAHWCNWNAEAAEHAEVVLCLDRIGLPELQGVAGLAGYELPTPQEALAAVPHDVNHKREAKRWVPRRLVFHSSLRRRARVLYAGWCG